MRISSTRARGSFSSSEMLRVCGSGICATCFKARSHRKLSGTSASRSSSRTGGPIDSISTRVRIPVCVVITRLRFLSFFGGGDRLAGVDGGKSLTRVGGLLAAAGVLVEFGELAQDVLRLGLELARGFEVLDGLVLAPRADQHRGDVGATLELALGAREVAVGVVVLAEPDLRQREVVEDARVAGREPRGPLQLVHGRAVVAVQVERVAE